MAYGNYNNNMFGSSFKNWKKSTTKEAPTKKVTMSGRAASAPSRYPKLLRNYDYGAQRNYLAGPGSSRAGQRYKAFTANLPKLSARGRTEASIKKIARAAVMDNVSQKFLSVNYNANPVGHNIWNKGPQVNIHPYEKVAGGYSRLFGAHTNMLKQIRLGDSNGQRKTSHIQIQTLDLNFKIRTLNSAPNTKYRVVVYTTPFGSKHAETDADKSPLPPQVTSNPDAQNDILGAGIVAVTAADGIFGIDPYHCMINQDENGVRVLCDESFEDPKPPALGMVGSALTAFKSEFVYKMSIDLNRAVEYAGDNGDKIFSTNHKEHTNIHVAYIAYDPSHHTPKTRVEGMSLATATAPSNLVASSPTPIASVDCRYVMYYKDLH